MGLNDYLLRRKLDKLDRADSALIMQGKALSNSVPTNMAYMASRNRLIKNNLRGMAQTMGLNPSEQTLNDYVNVLNYNNPVTRAVERQLNVAQIENNNVKRMRIARQQAIADARIQASAIEREQASQQAALQRKKAAELARRNNDHINRLYSANITMDQGIPVLEDATGSRIQGLPDLPVDASELKIALLKK